MKEGRQRTQTRTLCLPPEQGSCRCGQCRELPLLTCSTRRGREKVLPLQTRLPGSSPQVI